MSVGARLRKIREAKKWSTRRLEMETERLGRKVSHGFISQIENPRYNANPSLATINILARALGVPPSVLLSDEGAGMVDAPGELNAPSPILARIKEMAGSAGVAFDNLLKVAQVTESDLAQLDPDEPDPHVLWPVAQILGTSMSYLAGLTDRVKPIIGPGQALHDSRNLYRADTELDPEDVWDLEQAYLEVKRRREGRKKKEGR